MRGTYVRRSEHEMNRNAEIGLFTKPSYIIWRHPMTEHRIYNFNAGPAALPLEVLEEIKDSFSPKPMMRGLPWRATMIFSGSCSEMTARA